MGGKQKRPGGRTCRGVWETRRNALVTGLTRRPGFSFVDAQGAAAKAEVVQSFNGGIGFAVLHFHKTEPAGAAGFPVADEFHGQDAAVFGKKILNLFCLLKELNLTIILKNQNRHLNKKMNKNKSKIVLKNI